MRRVVLSTLTAAPLAVGLLVALPTAPASAVGSISINEVESDDPVVADFVEIKNSSGSAVDISGYVVKDNDDGHIFTIPNLTSLSAGGYYVAEVAGSFGLGGADSARLFSPVDLVNPIDSYTWTEHAPLGTYSRCPDGTGDFVVAPASKGFTNACPAPEHPWPGGATVADADSPGVLGSDISGLAYEGTGSSTPGTIWAFDNGDSRLHKLTKTGGTWSPATTWDLHYPGGVGTPDTEGATLTSAGSAGGVFASVERDGSNNAVSRPGILRFDPTGPGGALSATREWNLTTDLPGLGANTSIEALAWVPDSYLTSKGFKDQHLNKTYTPSDYPNHGSGLFFAGVEQDGGIYAYALDQSGSAFTRVATVTDVFPTVADLAWDADQQRLWVVCDNACNGRVALYDVQTAAGPNQGAFTSTGIFERPTGMPNYNNEGFTVARTTECVNGVRPAFWADDSDDLNHALRTGTIACSVAPTITGAASSSKAKTASGWYGAPVTVSFTCAAGVLPLSGACPAAVTLSASGADQSVTRSVSDTGGSTAQATVSNVDIDLAKPKVKIKGVKKGKTYPHLMKPKCKASDALSGLAGKCKVKQKKKGSKVTVTATATDNAGNVATTKVTYKVKKK